ncbi:glycogenin-2 isoform X1 [Drosophila bipectinata]|uniref:glycogenin-2 isoform X1 n=1 Tax=Drosophila bipectinata TaxID=42026 RepID=UPI001C89067F|nr:glycogenin-1 isoform X1 [Drosophila bipectinata]
MSKFAWVTLTTNDTYSLGALVLAHSLKRAGTAHQLAVLVTPTVSEAMRDRLKDVYNVVQEVNVLDSQDAANLALLARPELGVTFTKLHCWRLVQFEKCVFLDADTLVLQNCDELFEREELSAAPDVSWPDCFNSGVFVFRPSVETFGQITEFAVKNGSFDGGDQGLLNQFFADWATADIKKHLPFVYNVTAYASYCYLPAFKQFRDKIKILHFAGKLKPWLIQFNSETKTATVSSDYAHAQDLIQLWWNIFCDNVIQSLSTDMQTPGTAASEPEIASECLCLNLTHSPSDYAADEQWLDQDYEQRQQHEYYQQQRLHHHLLHERQFRDPWADYYENLEKEQRHTDEHEQHNPSQNHDDGHAHANANAYESATEWHNDDACHPPSQPTPPPPNPPQTQSSTANAKEDSASVDVNSNELNHPPPPEHALASDSAMPNATASATATPMPTPTPTPTPSSTPTPHHSVHSQTVENATNHQQEQEVAAKTAPEAGLAGALSQLKIGEQRTAEQEAYENLMRRQCWESGQIDYSGADSFDNIWKKITQTLEKKPDADQTGSS